MGTEPLNNAEIKAFLEKRDLQFEVYGKQSINGPFTNPLQKYLRRNSNCQVEQTGVCEPITWNFEKFLVNPKGKIVEHWESSEPLNPYELTDKLFKYVS